MSKLTITLSTLFLLFFHSLLPAQVQIGQDIDGEAAGDQSGYSVSMPDANTIAIGAVTNDGNGTNAGHVRVYERNGSVWTQKGGDIDGESMDDWSGVSLNMPNANTVAIGATFNDGNGSDRGHVRIYRWNGTTWVQRGSDIDGVADVDNAGSSVSMPDDITVAVGAYRNNVEIGQVRIFTWNAIAWLQKGGDILGESFQDLSGASVSMPDANTVAIGAITNDGNGTDAGHVRIYEWNNITWVQKGQDIDGEAAGDYSGRSVSMPDANTVAIGADQNDGNGTNAGHVRIFTWNGTAWVQKGSDIDGEAAGDLLGFSVSMPDANTVAVGAHGNDGNGTGNLTGQVRIYRWNGTTWVRKGLEIIGEAASDYSGRTVSMPDANTVAIGALGNDGNGIDAGHVRIYKLKGVSGAVYQDLNQNCIQNQNETGIGGLTFVVQPGNMIVQSSSNGLWVIDSLPAGTYSITADTSNSNWQITCPATQTFTVTHPDSLTIIPAFGYISTQPCSAPKISIYAPFLRPGFSNQKVYVQACNQSLGTTMIDSAYMVVELDSLLTVTGASLPYTSLGNNKYQVYLADSLFPGQCINFTFDCTLSLNAVLGQTLCMQAELYPVDSCALDSIPDPFPVGTVSPCNTLWDKSSLQVEGVCNNDTICFYITNTGDPGVGDMTCFSPVRLYIDGQFALLDSVLLTGGTSRQFCFAGQGRTLRLEVDQHPLHPGNSNPNATVELCGNPNNWTSDLVNVLPQDDADPVRDIYCGVVTGSYDPNDKTGYPLGVDSANYIIPNQDIEYRIRFQNTGNDTAFTVVIRDTLPQELDIFSVRSGVSSHDYSFRMYGPRVLEWTFNNILLPDSTTNEPESHGFVKFKVKQQPDLPIGTVINNKAGIYFDFNPPIITNTYHHTVDSLVPFSWDELDTIIGAICDSFSFRDVVYTQPGSFSYPIFSTGGDTLITVDLVALQTDTTIQLSNCDSVGLNGQNYYSSGMYDQVLTNTVGCDSIIHLEVDVINSSNYTFNQTSCDSFILNGQSYFNSGIYQQLLSNSVGCDSLITLDLTILNTTTETLNESTCDSFMLNGQTFTSSGTYTQNLTNSAGCDSTLTLNLSVENSSSIDSTINWDGSELVVMEAGASYQWLDCDNGNSPLAGATNQTFSPTNNGNYAVEISMANCTVVSPCFAVTNVSTINTPNGLPLRVYPNPTRDQLVVELGDLVEAQLELYDARGRLLRSLLTSSSRSELDLKALPAGLYLLRVQANGQSQTVKVVKR